MDWHQHFEQVFFNTWARAGLPDDKDFDALNIDVNGFSDFKEDWVINEPNLPPGLQTYQLKSVYGFGVMVGVMFSRMLALDNTQTKLATDWCGRFNLGISLFDYICDELGGMDSVLTLNVFEPFSGAADSQITSPTAAEALLSKLVSSVLNDLEKSTLKRHSSYKKDRLFKLLHQLFEAENFISKERLFGTVDLKKVKQALYLKSAAPFIVMAEYSARMAAPHDELLIKKARDAGKAVGCCYWVIDDAKDVWPDLAAGQWNLFLQVAAVEKPQLFTAPSGEFTQEQLMNIWKNAKHAEKIASQTARQLINAFNKLNPPAQERRVALGFLAASMWQWYQS